MLDDSNNVVLENLFDAEKAEKNIYDIDKAINDMLNQ